MGYPVTSGLRLLLLIIVVGVVLYLVQTYLPMDAQIASLLRTLAIIIIIGTVIVWLLSLVGLDLAGIFKRGE